MTGENTVQEFLEKLTRYGSPKEETRTSKASAFDAIINRDTASTIKAVLNLSAETSSITEKIKYSIYVLNLSKEDPLMFLATSYYVMRDLSTLKSEDDAGTAYAAIFAAGQTDFEKIVMTATVAHKKYLRKQKPTKAPAEEQTYNIWIHPESSSIDAYMYEPDKEILSIRFKSGLKIYPYYGITKALFKKMHNAKSKGQFFAEHIKTCQ